MAAPRLISLSPDPDADRRAGVTTFPMTCHSGGSVDIYLEPVLASATSAGVRRLAGRSGSGASWQGDGLRRRCRRSRRGSRGVSRRRSDRRRIRAQDFADRPASQKERLFAVVATLGQHDEEATQAALAVEPAYLGVVASRKRFAQMRETLGERGSAPPRARPITNPAGFDIGARAPEEVALSILAEIVQVRRVDEPSSRLSAIQPCAGARGARSCLRHDRRGRDGAASR